MLSISQIVFSSSSANSILWLWTTQQLMHSDVTWTTQILTAFKSTNWFMKIQLIHDLNVSFALFLQKWFMKKFTKLDKTKTSKIATTNLWIVSNFIEMFTNLNHWGFAMTQDKTTYCDKSGFTCSPSIRIRYVHYTTKNNQSEGRIQIKPLPRYNHCSSDDWVLFQNIFRF